jgi:hypothetical protein
MTTTPFDTLVSFLTEHDIKFQAVADDRCVVLTASTSLANYPMIIRIGTNESLLHITVGLPIRATEARLAAVGEMILRINCCLSTGHFDLVHSDGELRFDWATWFPDRNLPQDMLGSALAVSVQACDAWFPAIARVQLNDADPREEFEARLAALNALEEDEDDTVDGEVDDSYTREF